NIRPWRATPREIDISPRAIARGSTATIKVSARRGFDRFHKVTLNGKELETRFISAGEIEATVPQQAVKEAGTYTIMLGGQGAFASSPAPAYLIVSFKK